MLTLHIYQCITPIYSVSTAAASNGQYQQYYGGGASNQYYGYQQQSGMSAVRSTLNFKTLLTLVPPFKF